MQRYIKSDLILVVDILIKRLDDDVIRIVISNIDSKNDKKPISSDILISA